MKSERIVDTWFTLFTQLKNCLRKMSHRPIKFGIDPQTNEGAPYNQNEKENEIERIIDVAERLRQETTGGTSLHKFARGEPINREDFLLLVLAGVLNHDLVERAYRETIYFYYQDNEKRGYIDETKIPCNQSSLPHKKCRARERFGNEVSPGRWTQLIGQPERENKLRR